MAVREYIGARYVPKFSDVNGGVWDNTYSYDAFEIVKNGNDYYTSKKPVPVGAAITDTTYWVQTGNYNGAIATLDAKIGNLGALSPNFQSSVVDAIKGITCFVTPQMFGAVGDGITDDTTALQNCFDYGIDNAIAVYIPAGTYNFTSLVISACAFGYDEYKPLIIGASKGEVTLNHTGSGVAVTIIPKGNVGYIDGIILKDISIKGNANTTNGIEFAERGTKVIFDNITVSTCSGVGILQTHDFWVSSLTNILIFQCADGLGIIGNTTTSIYYNEIYVMKSSNDYAFNIHGSYSEVGILAADQCTGVNVYFFDDFGGVIGSIGCENCNVSHSIFRFRNACCNVGYMNAWNPTLTTMPTLCSFVQSKVEISDLRSNAPSAITTTVTLLNLYYSIVNLINGFTGNITYELPASTENASMVGFNGVKFRPKSGRSYLGFDRIMPASVSDSPFNGDLMGNALYSCNGGPRKRGDGENIDSITPVKKGDWFIELDPEGFSVAGYVILEDYTGNVSDAKKSFIPLMLSGSTSDRPSVTHEGMMYFDTTLGKPIWKHNSNWVDATGATV